MNSPLVVLNPEQVVQKTERIAHQIYEHYHDEPEVVLVGIAKKGYEFAQRIHKSLDSIAKNNFILASIELDKEHPFQSDCHLSIDAKDIQFKPVILVDDVLNSGKTLIYACKHLLEFQPKKITTTVLVDRRHRKFPVRADFVGLTLSTTLEEHIDVDWSKNQAFIK